MAERERPVRKAISAMDSMGNTQDDIKLLTEIRKNVELDADATEEQRELEMDDLRFCDPQTQWSDAERASREEDGRPVLTEDRLGPFLLQVCNEQRKNKPGVTVNPVDDGADVETAEVLQGLIRHIEYDSNADTAYDTAFESAVRVGRGFYRICTEYADDDSFDQVIKIKRIPNVHNVFIDPAAQESDYSDAKWGGIKNWMSQRDYEAQYPDSKLANIGADSWKSIGDDAPEWMSKDGSACLVVEYFYKKETPVKKYLLKSGKVVDKLPAGQTAKAVRDSVKVETKWVKCTALEILERGEWPSKYIPIVPVLGKEVMVNGNRTYAGLVRAGKDPQKRHNYLLTSQVERIAFMPLATWLGAKGFMGKNRRVWENAHKAQMAALEFEIIGDDGQGINMPKLITEEAPIRAVTEAMAGAEEGMKAVLGMYDPSLGNREGSQSGLAIGRLQQQSETGTFHFQDNLSRAIRYEGRILLDLVPVIYDTERIIRIIGEDGEQQTIKVNAPLAQDDVSEGDVKAAIGKVFDLTTGKYDVTVSAGPSYQSKRAEDRAMLIGMLQGPMGEKIANVAPDLLASTLDSPIAAKLTERLKKTLPPQITGDQQQIPPQVQQQLDQSGKMIEMLTQELKAASDKNATTKMELEAKERIAIINAQAGILEAAIKTGSQESIALLGHQMNMLNMRWNLDDGNEPIGTDTEPPAQPQGLPPGAGAPPSPQGIPDTAIGGPPPQPVPAPDMVPNAP